MKETGAPSGLPLRTTSTARSVVARSSAFPEQLLPCPGLQRIGLNNTQVTPKYRKRLYRAAIDAYRKDHGLPIPPK